MIFTRTYTCHPFDGWYVNINFMADCCIYLFTGSHAMTFVQMATGTVRMNAQIESQSWYDFICPTESRLHLPQAVCCSIVGQTCVNSCS